MDVNYTSFVSLLSSETSGNEHPSKFSLHFLRESFKFGMSCLLERFNLKRSSAFPKLALLLRNTSTDEEISAKDYHKQKLELLSVPTSCLRLIPYSQFQVRHAKNSITRDSSVHACDFIFLRFDTIF